MAEETKDGMAAPMECGEFEALLSEAIDGAGELSGARKESFDAHRRVCPVCGPLFADAQAGQQWLRSLEPAEPPVHLVHNILAATSGVVSKRTLTVTAGGRTAPFAERAREWWDSFSASLRPAVGFVRQPRFVMSFGMIFFSFSVALSAAGVKASDIGSDIAKISLRPAAIRHAYNDAQIRVVKYYDNIRFVYEIESKLRELKRANTPAEPGPEFQKNEQKDNRKDKDNTSGEPEQRQDRNYSRDNGQVVLAAMTEGWNEVRRCGLRAAGCEQTQDGSWRKARSSTLPVVTATTNRRYV